MGLHAFTQEPAHCAAYRGSVGGPLPPLWGFGDRWNMPAARHRRSLGTGVAFPGVDHYVLTYHIGGASARRPDRAGTGGALDGALSLQRPGSGGTFASAGLVDYGHFYFTQELVCEVAEGVGMVGSVAPDDFFAVTDPVWGRDAEAYLFRAGDRQEPPTAIEMDSRAYLIVVGLLRTAFRRQDLTGMGPETSVRPDLHPVLRAIDDRLSENLRLSDLAGLVDLSPFHFARLFRQAMGEPPGKYLLRRRTERAVELIKGSRLSLAEIAYRTGFSSQSHMTRRVKALTGTTPGRLRTDSAA